MLIDSNNLPITFFDNPGDDSVLNILESMELWDLQ